MEPVIEIKNVSKTYGIGKNLKKALSDISLTIDPGQIIGYIGPNGAGKSTTIKILAGLLDDFEGQVTILGMDIRSNAMEMKSRIGYIPENAALYDVLTPMEYITFIGELYHLNRDEIEKKAKNLLELFELKSVRNHRINTFSKGMKQKVLIISGLIHNPEVIFLDEPLGGLDANTVIVVKEVLRQLAIEGKTIFYSSHIMDVVERISDRIILIDQGKVIADGSIEQLRGSNQQETLENLFSQLTGNNDQAARAEKIVGAFEDKIPG